MSPQAFSFAIIMSLTFLFTSCTPPLLVVYPVGETDPVDSKDDAADDPAIYIHPKDPYKSAIIGTDKSVGLAVFDTEGKTLHKYEVGRVNNVDLRQGVAFGAEQITVVGGSNRSDNTLVFFRLDDETRELIPMHEAGFPSQVDEVYGFCLYHHDGLYAFVVGKDGQVEQWKLRVGGDSKLEAEVVRTFDVGTQCEGMVADDELQYVYIGEENVGIWKYGANPGDGNERTLVQAIADDKHFKADVEGLAIYSGDEESGYLLASIQGNNSYAVFERGGENRYLLSFQIKKSGEIDRVSDTDGIEVNGQAFGALQKGVFIAQDGRNGKENQNFKLVDWEDIERLIRKNANPKK
jgi:3-phytase